MTPEALPEPIAVPALFEQVLEDLEIPYLVGAGPSPDYPAITRPCSASTVRQADSIAPCSQAGRGLTPADPR